mmetsp:Transcript_119015/g.216512  ORF Transcript_119015/g.216512 Transcript_119015/m.216512 type:complete len:107 (+) Transcript_119015:756-1076(+)
MLTNHGLKLILGLLFWSPMRPDCCLDHRLCFEMCPSEKAPQICLGMCPAEKAPQKRVSTGACELERPCETERPQKNTLLHQNARRCLVPPSLMKEMFPRLSIHVGC